jgi:hypothetical protein
MALGFVALAWAYEVTRFDLSRAGLAYEIGSQVGFYLETIGGVALACAIDRRWVLLLPLAIIPLYPLILNAGYVDRFAPDDIDVLSAWGLVFYAAINLIVWESFVLFGLLLRRIGRRLRSRPSRLTRWRRWHSAEGPGLR